MSYCYIVTNNGLLLFGEHISELPGKRVSQEVSRTEQFDKHSLGELLWNSREGFPARLTHFPPNVLAWLITWGWHMVGTCSEGQASRMANSTMQNRQMVACSTLKNNLILHSGKAWVWKRQTYSPNGVWSKDVTSLLTNCLALKLHQCWTSMAEYKIWWGSVA